MNCDFNDGLECIGPVTIVDSTGASPKDIDHVCAKKADNCPKEVVKDAVVKITAGTYASPTWVVTTSTGAVCTAAGASGKDCTTTADCDNGGATKFDCYPAVNDANYAIENHQCQDPKACLTKTETPCGETDTCIVSCKGFPGEKCAT